MSRRAPAPVASPPPGPVDAVVVGGGMAGATLALALKSGGLDVTLLDAAPLSAQIAPSFDGRASAISFAAFRQWRALGVAERLLPDAQRIDQILITDGRAGGAASPTAPGALLRFDAAEIADRADGEPLGWMLENRVIRAGLAAALADAGVEVRAPARVRALEADDAFATVTLDDGRRLSASVIVGADGRDSAVRRLSGIGVLGWDYGHMAIVATLDLERDHGGVAYEHFLPSGPFAILPLTGRRASLVWTERKARAAALRTAGDDAFAAHLARRFGDFLGAATPAGPRFAYPLSLQLAETIVGPRAALIGDAAHAVHPIAGQGLNMGLKDVAALAEILVDAVRLGEDPGAPATLARYRRWRGLDNIAVAVATDGFNRLFSTGHPLVRAARGAGLRLVHALGPARRAFMLEAGGAAGDLPRLLRGESL